MPCCFARRRIGNKLLSKPHKQRSITMAMYISLLQFTEQGIRSVKDTTKRAATATAEAERMGLKVRDSFWTLGPYDVVLLLEAPDDQSVTAFTLKLGSLGNVKTQTMRAFRSEEMEGILAKIK